MNTGLHVEFNGKKNIVISNGIVKEYPIGGMICEYARLDPKEIKKYILHNPFFSEGLVEKVSQALIWMFEQLLEEYGIVTASIVVADFCEVLKDYTNAPKGKIEQWIQDIEGDKHANRINQFILEDSGYKVFGITTLGQALLTAYASYAYSYVSFKHCFDMLVEEYRADEKQVDLFLKLYYEDIEIQEIDYMIMMYEGGFHSVYTIKSSISLLLFEAAHVIDEETKFVKCKNCNKYFVPVGRSDMVYCGYPAPQNKRRACRDIGAQATSIKKMKSDTVAREYRRIYMRLKMRLRRNIGDEKLKRKLRELTDGMKEWRKKRDLGEVSSDDILDWLYEIDDTI